MARATTSRAAVSLSQRNLVGGAKLIIPHVKQWEAHRVILEVRALIRQLQAG